jgi:Polyketide cyclase / dehydrase and lipid transport
VKACQGGARRLPVRIPEDAIDIRRPVADVFEFVADTTNDPKWHTTVVRARRVSLGPVGLGTVFEGDYDSKKKTLETPPRPGNFQSVRATITEYAPGRALRLHVDFTDPPRGIGARVLGQTFDLTFRFESLLEAHGSIEAVRFSRRPSCDRSFRCSCASTQVGIDICSAT